MAWVRCSGRGRVDSYVIQHGQVGFSAGSPSTAVEILAVVAIDEGPRMLAILAGTTPDGVRLDMPVEIVFEDVGDGPTLFKFKPA